MIEKEEGPYEIGIHKYTDSGSGMCKLRNKYTTIFLQMETVQ